VKQKEVFIFPQMKKLNYTYEKKKIPENDTMYFYCKGNIKKELNNSTHSIMYCIHLIRIFHGATKI